MWGAQTLHSDQQTIYGNVWPKVCQPLKVEAAYDSALCEPAKQNIRHDCAGSKPANLVCL